MRLPFQEEAVAELEEAAAWYERERPSYGGLFVAEVRRTVERAADLPRLGTTISGTDPQRDVRRFAVQRFPYLIITALVTGQHAVIAVAHARRRPNYWRDRLE